MDGFININKAPGMTSFGVIKRIKKILPDNKFGHLGTLDPMAEGVLPIAVGYATRLIEYVGDTDKVYRTTMTLGGISDTQDAWGNIIYQPHIEFEAGDLEGIVKKYTGVIQQTPPMYSAVHHQGQRLYDLARQGIIVERQAREIRIEYIKLLSLDEDRDGRPTITMEVACSQGTYIRTLCHDIGQDLGTGAYMSALQRIRAGVFSIDQAYSLEEIQPPVGNWNEIIKAVDYPLQHLQQYSAEGATLEKILNGNRVSIGEKTWAGHIKIYDPQCKLVAIAICVKDDKGTWLQPRKVFT